MITVVVCLSTVNKEDSWIRYSSPFLVIHHESRGSFLLQAMHPICCIHILIVNFRFPFFSLRPFYGYSVRVSTKLPLSLKWAHMKRWRVFKIKHWAVIVFYKYYFYKYHFGTAFHTFVFMVLNMQFGHCCKLTLIINSFLILSNLRPVVP